jgi:drug/metabolite transporter (DMT)-like permease
MFAGFYAWYRGLAVGGIAKISQLQLAQPVLTLGWSVLLLGERVGTTMSSPALLATVPSASAPDTAPQTCLLSQ